MKVLNVGSLNIDHVYEVDHFVQPGETLLANDYQRCLGGKGFNQSIALARAGAKVYHAGKIGEDGEVFLKACAEEHINTKFILKSNLPTGHAIIQIDSKGQNSIILHGGANQDIDESNIDSLFADCDKGDYLVVQNEVSGMASIINTAKARGMTIVFNPAPITPEVKHYPLKEVDIFILNEIEAEQLSGHHEPATALSSLQGTYPQARIIITLGAEGVIYGDEQGAIQRVPAQKVKAVDTTAAGDTFVGYTVASLIKGEALNTAISRGVHAAAITVQSLGASPSIPHQAELCR
jgi:ribokinase